ncbi:MAG TPA: hypothetical protein VN700_00840 [Vicinamibacterales bacterium]|nr:hypothetical protein [Vicinamibacterales bacterium]
MANPELALYIVTAAGLAQSSCCWPATCARAEERLMEPAFAQTYRDYMAHTRRFIPGIY